MNSATCASLLVAGRLVLKEVNVLCSYFLLLLLLVFAPSSFALSKEEASCKSFVREFYAWYFGKSKSPGPKDVCVTDLALKQRAVCFSPELSRLLKEDSAAQAKVPGEIVGLDFDPILNTQAEADRYETGNVIRRGNNYLVEVYGYWDKKKSTKPDVLPELALVKGKWQFVNFRYKSDREDDLISILKGLRDERSKSKVK